MICNRELANDIRTSIDCSYTVNFRPVRSCRIAVTAWPDMSPLERTHRHNLWYGACVVQNLLYDIYPSALSHLPNNSRAIFRLLSMYAKSHSRLPISFDCVTRRWKQLSQTSTRLDSDYDATVTQAQSKNATSA